MQPKRKNPRAGYRDPATGQMVWPAPSPPLTRADLERVWNLLDPPSQDEQQEPA